MLLAKKLFPLAQLLLGVMLLITAGCQDNPSPISEDIQRESNTAGPGLTITDTYYKTLDGQLQGITIEGLYYEIPQIFAGFTSEEGHYAYAPEQSMQFWLGDLLLFSDSGTATAAPLMLLDEETAITLLQILMTFDKDGDYSNGIHVDRHLYQIFQEFPIADSLSNPAILNNESLIWARIQTTNLSGWVDRDLAAEVYYSLI